MRSGTERNKDTTLCSTKQETWLNGGKRRRGKRWRKRDKKRETERDSEKGQHRRRRGRLEGDQQAGYTREGERGGETEERKRWGEGTGLIYRRGISVIISPSLSRATLGSERGLSRGGPSPSSHLPDLSICTLPATVIAVARSHLSAHRSRSLRGTLEWPRRPFSSVGAPHSPFLSSIVSANFPRASRGTGVGSRGDVVSVP